MKSAKLFDKGRRQISSFMISRFAPVQAWLTAQEQNDSKFLDSKLILESFTLAVSSKWWKV